MAVTFKSPGHDHHSLDGHDLRRASKRSLIVALVLKVGYMLADIVGGIPSGSLALLAHAGHMLTDAASIALALVAMHSSAGLPPQSAPSAITASKSWRPC